MDPDVVSIQDLHTRLGFSVPLDYPKASFLKPLVDWKMEIDDSPIFRYIYRNFKPRRHLEFGTWEGTGVLYCLEECRATIWTINVLEGEKKSDGSWAYSTTFDLRDHLPFWSNKKKLSKGTFQSQTDALGFIGRHYLENGSGYRVCQIYCDSREWDISNYPEGFFDSALIDGGHSEEVVSNDTHKALKLLRSGGLIMWHDFCLDKYVQQKCSSTQGVMASIRRNWPHILEQVDDIFWVNPSWILIGVKK